MKRQIPNILSGIRIALIPLFVHLYFNRSDERILAVLVFALASATDILDGYLARHFGWITPIGKLLDPLADKLMQAAVIVCISIENPFFFPVAVLFGLKELAMVAGSLIVIKRKKAIAVSTWYGKGATVAFFCISLIAIFNKDNKPLNATLAVLLGAVLCWALLMYYFKVFRGYYGITRIKNPKSKLD